MAGEEKTDPFLWDEDRVVQELCTPNRTWKAPQAKRLPDPATLEASLRECGVDGETLLTYGDEFGFDRLWSSLGVKKLPHQLSLKDAITQLRRRSPGYSEWKTQQLADNQAQGEDNDGLTIKSESHHLAGPEHAVPTAPLAGPLAFSPDAEMRPAPAELPKSCQGVLSPTLSPSAGPDLPAPREISEVTDSVQEEVPDGPPAKKRRLAPTTLSAAPTGNSAFATIPTEGDLFLSGAAEVALQADSSFGFLGGGVLLLRQLTTLQGVDDEEADQDEFSWARNDIAPGRRIQVSSAMKRFLLSGHAGRFNSNLDQDQDDVLPLMGDSDGESVDSETWREYQEEEEERLAQKAREEAERERLLTKDQVTEAVRDVIQQLESQWVAAKKPKHDLKAWKIWQDARKNPDRLALIDSAKKQLDRFDTRIALYSHHIISQPWSVNDDVHRKASDFLEVTVFEKKYQAWRIDVLESPRQPAKPATLPRPAPKLAKPVVLNADEEDLTSESEDLDAFIEYDDNEVPLVGYPVEMEIDSEPAPMRETAPTYPPPENSPSLEDEAVPGVPAQETSFADQVSGDLLMEPAPKEIKTEYPQAPTTPRIASTSSHEVIEIDDIPTPLKLTGEIPGLDDLESLQKIGEIGHKHWENVKDAERLVVAVLCEWPRAKIVKLFTATNSHDHGELWEKYISPTIEAPASATADSIAFILCRLFDIFLSRSASRAESTTLRRMTCQRIDREGPSFFEFCALLGRVLPLFLGVPPPTPTRLALRLSRKLSPSAEETPEIRDPADDRSASEDDAAGPSTKKRRQAKRYDKNAQKMRTETLKVKQEQAQRARLLHERMAKSDSISSKQSRLIVNDTKESEDQALIYVNDHIGSKIKDHQIEGLRFLWNQVVVPSTVRQGCLLAHTMGLGKTMQVITLLVVIAESSASPDESVRAQIPENLRESKTLVLCPSSLVDNWQEEIRMWAPDDMLGPVYRMHATVSTVDRVSAIHDWSQEGGVLIIGYTMFSNLVRDDEELAKMLLESPNLVIGDEAHYLKNPESQRHQAAANFKTTSRIAMTGSPLTNNVMDYYSMINWVAPNYLADIAEFRQRFSNPINEGLYADSEPFKKRKARKLLQVLKATVEPKVHRRDIDVLLNALPKKREFIITLPLTKLQKRLYTKYIQLVTDPGRGMLKGQARVWSLVAKLSLVLAHPFIFKTVVEAQKAQRKAEKAKPSTSTPGAKTDEADDDEMPQDVLHDLLAAVAVREIEDYALSNKILVLLRILDECRKVGDKVLVFSQSLATLDYIENICKRKRVVYQRLDGGTRMATRQDSVKKFNTDASSEVYLISTTAGGVGLNIYGANRVVIFDFKYTPADEKQSIGRAYRLGQTKPVYVYWLKVGGTFEDTIENNAIFKTQLASRVVDKKNPDPWSKRYREYFAMPREAERHGWDKVEGQDQVLDALLKNEDINQHIRTVTSTETFEREETYELTPEEQKEVEADVKLELLRSQDPEEFKRQERLRLDQSRNVLAMPPPLPSLHPTRGFPQPPPANGESHAAPQSTTGRRPRVVIIKVPEHLRDKHKPEPPVPAVVPGAAFPQSVEQPTKPDVDGVQQQVLTLNSDPVHANRPNPSAVSPTTEAQTPIRPLSLPGNPATGPPMTPPNHSAMSDVPTQTPRTAVPQPILGTGTHFKAPAQAQSPLGLPNTAPSGPPPTWTSPATPSPMVTETLGSDWTGVLAVHSTLCQEGRHVRHHPNDLVARVKEILTRNRVESLPMTDKLQNIAKVSRNERFAEAMLSGYLEPEQLASMTRLEMDEVSKSLSDMSLAEFKQRVWTTKANLNVCTGTLSI